MTSIRKRLIDRLRRGGYEWEEIHALLDELEADIKANMQSSYTDSGTWCREHRLYDGCPETCPRCKWYWHGQSDCRYVR